MLTREILNSHPVATLRQEIRKHNVKGYSTMTKAKLIDEMMKRKESFSHIKMRGKPAPKSAPKASSKPAPKSKSTVDEDIRNLQNFSIPTVRFYKDFMRTKKERLDHLKEKEKNLNSIVASLKKVDRSKLDNKQKERLAFTLDLVPDYKEDIEKRRKDIEKM